MANRKTDRRKSPVDSRHARAAAATVPTANVGEFGRYRGSKVEHWLT
jgi:hypothetical protein